MRWRARSGGCNGSGACLGLAVGQNFQLTLKISAFFDRNPSGLHVAGHDRRLPHIRALADLKITLQRTTHAYIPGSDIRVHAAFGANAQAVPLKLNTAVDLAIYIDVLVPGKLSFNRNRLPYSCELLRDRCAHKHLHAWRESGTWI